MSEAMTVAVLAALVSGFLVGVLVGWQSRAHYEMSRRAGDLLGRRTAR